MNYRYIVYFTGRIMRIVAALFLFPAVIALIYGEYFNLVAFLPIGLGLFLIGMLSSLKMPKTSTVTAKEGFVIVALSWVLMSLAVAFTYLITGEIEGGFINCFFESVSGFTTTGSSIVNDVESLSYSINALRLFTHWVGGMGILVLVLAIIPKNLNATSMNIFRAEVPGHQVEKFTTKITLTAKILYLIYIGLTVILAVAFIIAKMPVYDSILHAMSIAGTGGFSIKNASLGAYNSLPIEIIATVFMFLFGVNFNIFYLILIGKFTTAIKSEELRVYTIIYVLAVLAMAGSLTLHSTYENFGEAVRYSAFEAAAISSTTGLTVSDFSAWPMFCQSIILVLMFIGGSSGSTAGGLKLSRIMITTKYAGIMFRKSTRPNIVKSVKLEGERLDKTTINSTLSYLALYSITALVSFVLVALFNDVILRENSIWSFGETLTAVISSMSNVGPAFGKLALRYNYSEFSSVSKLILCFDMLAGRLEILPMLFLFNPVVWKKL